MKILVVSDTHGNSEKLFSLLDIIKPVDMVIHCGDVEFPISALREKAECDVYAVVGNCDILRRDELYNELIIDAGKHNILITHGHKYNVKYSNAGLYDIAKERGADIVVYGHTHAPCIDSFKGTLIFNPGSIAYPRQEDRRCSYGILDIDDTREADKVKATICYLDNIL